VSSLKLNPKEENEKWARFLYTMAREEQPFDYIEEKQNVDTMITQTTTVKRKIRKLSSTEFKIDQ